MGRILDIQLPAIKLPDESLQQLFDEWRSEYQRAIKLFPIDTDAGMKAQLQRANPATVIVRSPLVGHNYPSHTAIVRNEHYQTSLPIDRPQFTSPSDASVISANKSSNTNFGNAWTDATCGCGSRWVSVAN